MATDSHPQGIRTPNNPRLPPPIRRRTRRQHNLLPHVPAIPNTLSLPRRRRDQSGHGPPQRTSSPQTDGRHRVRQAGWSRPTIPATRKQRNRRRRRRRRWNSRSWQRRLPVLPHHAQTPAQPDLRTRHARSLHRFWRVHACGSLEGEFQAMRGSDEGA